MKRYKFLEHDKITLPTGEVLTRVEYIGGAFDGMVGGYIEKEENLPHKGNGVVRNNAMVYGDAEVDIDEAREEIGLCVADELLRIYQEHSQRGGIYVSD